MTDPLERRPISAREYCNIRACHFRGGNVAAPLKLQRWGLEVLPNLPGERQT